MLPQQRLTLPSTVPQNTNQPSFQQLEAAAKETSLQHHHITPVLQPLPSLTLPCNIHILGGGGFPFPLEEALHHRG